MSKDPLAQINPRRGTPQREQARDDQVKNNAGGYVFKADDITRIERFLMLGTAGGTYYVNEQKHTKENAQFVIEFAKNDGANLVNLILDISTTGRAPKQNPALFALAVASVYSDLDGRSAAYSNLSRIARTASHLFQFITYREQLGGWSRGLRSAVSRWYNDKTANDVAYQMVKYRTRNNWSHRDLIRLAHINPTTNSHNILYKWALGKLDGANTFYFPGIVELFEQLQLATSVDEVVSLIDSWEGAVSWEMIPDKFINEPRVWKALFTAGIPQTALIRQLPRLTRMGMFQQKEFIQDVYDQLIDVTRLQKARVHPINVLMAQKIYTEGQGIRSSWTPHPAISDALDTAFYRSFSAVEPTNKRIMLAVDVSGSMDSYIGDKNITAMQAAAAMALVTRSVEPKSTIYGFSDGRPSRYSFSGGRDLTELDISPRRRLDDIVRYMQSLNFGRTDLALPMIHALHEKQSVDAFVIYTDNETWYGQVHPHEALKRYRQQMGINAKLIVVGMTSTGFTIADPLDTNTLDVVGFDAAVPTLINQFIQG